MVVLVPFPHPVHRSGFRSRKTPPHGLESPSEGFRPRGPSDRNPQAHNTSHTASLLCDPLARRGLRHSHRAGPDGAQRLQDDADLHARTSAGRIGGAESGRRACGRKEVCAGGSGPGTVRSPDRANRSLMIAVRLLPILSPHSLAASILLPAFPVAETCSSIASGPADRARSA